MIPNQPFFSIVIATYNRPQQLANCLESLSQLDYPHDRFEVIVVDDGSRASLHDVVTSFRQRMNIRLIEQANAGAAAARNTGVAHSQGEFVAFTDDDCTAAPNWLATLAQHFNATPEVMLGGYTRNRLTGNPFAATSQLIIDIVYRHYNADPQRARFFASDNMAMPAQRFRELGGFMTNFCTAEDRELCDRWLQRCWPMIYAPEAMIHHANNLSFTSFCKQHFSYGRGAYHYHKIRSQRGSGNMQEAMKFNASWRNWLLYPFRQVKSWQAFVLAGLLLVWQVINAAGFFWEAVEMKLFGNER